MQIKAGMYGLWLVKSIVGLQLHIPGPHQRPRVAYGSWEQEEKLLSPATG